MLSPLGEWRFSVDYWIVCCRIFVILLPFWKQMMDSHLESLNWSLLLRKDQSRLISSALAACQKRRKSSEMQVPPPFHLGAGNCKDQWGSSGQNLSPVSTPHLHRRPSLRPRLHSAVTFLSSFVVTCKSLAHQYWGLKRAWLPTFGLERKLHLCLWLNQVRWRCWQLLNAPH